MLMLRIERILDSDGTTFRLSGELRSAELHDVRTEIEKVMQITLDLIELSVVDRDGVRWLVACESVGFKVENSAPYIREWMRQEKS
jgi:ABC-type transporter Mla MlaB component